MRKVDMSRLYLLGAVLAATILGGCGATSKSPSVAFANSPAVMDASGTPSSSPSGSNGGAPGTGSSSGSSNNSGGSGSSATTPTEFLYALEGPDIEQFEIDSSTGALRSDGVTASTAGATSIVADPKSRYVYVAAAKQFAGFVQSYTIGNGGALTLTDQQTLPNECDSIGSLAIDPSGTNLYVSNTYLATFGHISTYALDRSTGRLTNSSPDMEAGFIGHILLNRAGTYAYVTRHPAHHYPPYAGNSGWGVLARNPTTGALTSAGAFNRPLTAPSDPGTQYFDGAFAGSYFFAIGAGGVYDTYAMTGAGTGTYLSRQTGNVSWIAADPSETFLVISHSITGDVQSLRVNADGSLTAISAQNAGVGANFVAFDSTGRFVYVGNSQTPQVFAFAFDRGSGALGVVPGSPFSAGKAVTEMTTAGR